MFRFGSNSLDLLGISLVLAGVALGCLPLLQPRWFERQDTVLILVALVAGGILWANNRSLDGTVQFSLYLLTVPAVFYTIEMIRLRARR